MSDDGDAVLAAHIAKLRRYGAVGPRAAALGAPRVLQAIQRTAKAGTTPEGVPWPPRKDGGRPLEHAAEHLSVRVDGSTIVLTLTGPDVIHNFGDNRNPKRQILPDAGAELPSVVLEAMRKAAIDAFNETMRGT
jgi:hypothetical protein